MRQDLCAFYVVAQLALEEDHEEAPTRVTTTSIHLARRIGEALVHAYQGDLDFTYGEAEKSIRVIWSRQEK